jgi:hypothetical protein
VRSFREGHFVLAANAAPAGCQLPLQMATLTVKIGFIGQGGCRLPLVVKVANRSLEERWLDV